jgi:hypothetical protein
MSVEYIIQISSGLLTPLIAIVAVYIAWQQSKTAKQKLTLDTYDRNLRIYEEVKKFLLIIIREGDVGFDEAIKFRSSVSEADFLFGSEIVQYIDEIYTRAINLRLWNEEYRDYTQTKPEGYDHSKVVEEKHKELVWLAAQLEPAKEKFRKYLSIKS